MSATLGTTYQNSSGGSGSTTITVTPTFSAGDSAHVALKVPNGTSITSVSDSVNGTTGWTSRAGPSTIGGADVYLYTRDNMAAGSPVVTLTVGASTSFLAIEVTPVSNTLGYDGTSSFNLQTFGLSRASNASGTPSSSGLAVGFIYNDTNNGTGAVDTGSGWVSATGSGVTAGLFWNFGVANNFAILEAQNYASGAQTATFTTYDNASQTTAIVTLFKDGSGGGGGGSASIAWIGAAG